MNCPHCSRLLDKINTLINQRPNGLEYERTEYRCSPDDIWISVDVPLSRISTQSAHRPDNLAGLKRQLQQIHIRQADDLNQKVQELKQLSHDLAQNSKADKVHLSKRIREIKEILSASETSLQKQRQFLLAYLNKNTAEILDLELQGPSSLTEVELQGLKLYEDRNKKELVGIESLLAIIQSEAER